MLLAMGVALEQDPAQQRVSLEGPAALLPVNLEIPGDFSSAAFFIVAACLGAVDGLVLRDVGVNPTRTGLITALNAMGARIELRHVHDRGAEPVADIHIERSTLHGIDLPSEWVPLAIDELPILFVAAAAASGETRVRGAQELRHKESDRITVMARGLAALGGEVRELPDGIIIRGSRLRGGRLDCCGDHRIAMSFAIASLIADGPIEIANTAQVATSFPRFIATANACGLRIEGSDGSGA
jgi:3-phosphoshikimate 1-carboxyvinyltransferase